MNKSHPWQSSADEFEKQLLPELERIGKEIGAAADKGNACAVRIINLYAMLHRSFDPMTMTRLKDVLNEYKQRKEAT